MSDFIRQLMQATPYEVVFCLMIFGVSFAVLGVN